MDGQACAFCRGFHGNYQLVFRLLAGKAIYGVTFAA